MSENVQYYSDIHMHVIPGVDDGAGSMDIALSMLKLAEVEGMKDIIATPHSGAFDHLTGRVLPKFKDLKRSIERSDLSINLMLGSEIYVDGEEIEAAIRKLKKGKYPTLNGSRYVLIEFDLCSDDISDAAVCINRLTESGYIPIIAHAEKYKFDVNDIYELKEMGSLIQVNYTDTIPFSGSEMTYKTSTMLKDEMVDFVATDAHNMTTRRPEITDAIGYLKDNCPAQYLEKLLYNNSQMIVEADQSYMI